MLIDSGGSLVEKANALNLERKYDEAEKIYVQLLEQNHDNSGLLSTLGTLYLNNGKLGLAIALLHKAIDKNEQSDYLTNLGIAYKFAGQYPKALAYLEKAIKNNPSAETLNTYGAMFVNVGEPEKLLKPVRKALEMRPDYALAHWNLAQALLELGKWDTAWEEHEWGLEHEGVRLDRKLGGKPRWNGEPGTVAVYGEQGLGDEIMFASMLPDLMKTNNVILECHPRLLTLFQRSFPDVKCFGTRDQPESGTSAESFDYQIAIGSLGKFFRRSVESFPGTPYLKADGEKGKRIRVGISWTGGQKEGRVRVRSIPLPWWKSILNNDCEFVSLQYTRAEAELKLMNDLGYSIEQNDAVFAEDYYETAKLVKSCDLVISCCTSVIHLAGALGVPTWCAVPSKPAWRYGVKGPMPWYRSVRLYRQPKGDVEAWMPVIERIGFDLGELLKEQKAA